MKVLLTSSSFQDVKGKHSELLFSQGYEITALNGPTSQAQLLDIAGSFDALLCGDDEISADVLIKGKQGRLKYISKYGSGVDNINIVAAKELGILVTNCPGVNQVSVAELVFGLLLSFARNVHLEYEITKQGEWKKLTGFELYNKTIGIVGFGAIGKEVAKRAKAFGMHVIIYTPHPDIVYINQNGYALVGSLSALAAQVDIITFHIPLTRETRQMINDDFIEKARPGIIIINVSRGGLADTAAIINGLRSGVISGYLTDVLDTEPMPANYPLKDMPNVLITPHIGSRTFESTERQGVMATENLINMIDGNTKGFEKNLV